MNMKFKFKLNAGTIAILLAVVLSIIALIFSGISNSRGAAASASGAYAVSGFGAVVACGVIAIILLAAAFVCDSMFEGTLFSILVDVMKLVAAGLLIACFSIMIDSREALMGNVWFSDLESGNANAVSALSMALVSWIMYGLAIVGVAVSAYGTACAKTVKKDNDGSTSDESTDEETVTSSDV